MQCIFLSYPSWGIYVVVFVFYLDGKHVKLAMVINEKVHLVLFFVVVIKTTQDLFQVQIYNKNLIPPKEKQLIQSFYRTFSDLFHFFKDNNAHYFRFS